VRFANAANAFTANFNRMGPISEAWALRDYKRKLRQFNVPMQFKATVNWSLGGNAAGFCEVGVTGDGWVSLNGTNSRVQWQWGQELHAPQSNPVTRAGGALTLGNAAYTPTAESWQMDQDGWSHKHPLVLSNLNPAYVEELYAQIVGLQELCRQATSGQ
jgi:hypothetical protein